MAMESSCSLKFGDRRSLAFLRWLGLLCHVEGHAEAQVEDAEDPARSAAGPPTGSLRRRLTSYRPETRGASPATGPCGSSTGECP